MAAVLAQVRAGEHATWTWRSLAVVVVPLAVLLVAIGVTWIPLYDDWRPPWLPASGPAGP